MFRMTLHHIWHYILFDLITYWYRSDLEAEYQKVDCVLPDLAFYLTLSLIVTVWLWSGILKNRQCGLRFPRSMVCLIVCSAQSDVLFDNPLGWTFCFVHLVPYLLCCLLYSRMFKRRITLHCQNWGWTLELRLRFISSIGSGRRISI